MRNGTAQNLKLSGNAWTALWVITLAWTAISGTYFLDIFEIFFPPAYYLEGAYTDLTAEQLEAQKPYVYILCYGVIIGSFLVTVMPIFTLIYKYTNRH